MREKMITRFIPSFILRLVWYIVEKMQEFNESRIARKRTELKKIRRRIREVESGLPLLAANVRNTAHAEDYGSEAWRARVAKRSAEVKCDNTFLEQLKARKVELKKELGMT